MLRRFQSWWRSSRSPIQNNPSVAARLRVDDAQQRAQQRAQTQRTVGWLNTLIRIDWEEHLIFLKTLLRWVFIGSLVGVLAGTASAIFLVSLQWATNFRLEFPNLLFLLPLGGVFIGWLYYRFAGDAARGNNLVIEEVNLNRGRIPLRMAPMILAGTVLTHLFGGSAGREGTAIQMSTSLADGLRRLLRLQGTDRRMILMAGISGGFGSVFGTPIAGFVFGMEVQSMGRIRYEGVIPCLVAALVGDLVTRAWGVSHSHYPALMEVTIDAALLVKVGAAGIAFGLTSLLFVELTDSIRHQMRERIRLPPLRPFIGGVIIITATLILGTRDYLGLSLPLLQNSVNGTGVETFAFLFKLIFTAVTLGTGFLGGEVTPLFVIGSTLGYTLGRLLGVEPTFMASIGFVAVFAGASNTPLACTLMGLELFGGGSALYVAVGCFIAYLASGHRGIYVTQLVDSAKTSGFRIEADENLASIAKRRSGWLPIFNSSLAEMPVKNIMSPNPISIHGETKLIDAIEVAVRGGVRTLPVIDEHEKVVGIVTDRDLRQVGLQVTLGVLRIMFPAERAAALHDMKDIPIKEIMSSPSITLSQTAVLGEAVELMLKKKLKRLPVIDRDNHLVGMITRSDILREYVFTQPTIDHAVQHVGQLNLAEVMTIPDDMVVQQAVELMETSDKKRLVVLDKERKVVGILTDSDVLVRLERDAQRGLKLVNEVMTSSVYTVSPETTIQAALRLLIEHQIKRLPVVNGEGHVLGLVGRAELMRALLESRTPEDSAT